MMLTLPCLCLTACNNSNYDAVDLQHNLTIDNGLLQQNANGILNLQNAPYYLDDDAVLQGKRVTKVQFACNNPQKGQHFTLFVYNTQETYDATRLQITLDGNYTTANNVVTVDLDDTVVWISKGSRLAFFDTNDTVDVLTSTQNNAISLTGNANVCLPLSVFTHDYGNHNVSLSVLGDSISTFDGISNNPDYNTTIVGQQPYYPRYDVTKANQTWWDVACQMTGATMLVNNSWSGSRVTNQVSAAYRSRCVNLHNDRTNQMPDVIAFYMGTNDLGNVDVGSFESVDEIYQQNQYVKPRTFAHSYAICLHKMTTSYPNSKIFVFTLPNSKYSTDQTVLDAYNQTIVDLANYFGCYVVNLQQMDYYHYSTHTNDNLHPNSQGMLLIADYFCRRLQEVNG